MDVSYLSLDQELRAASSCDFHKVDRAVMPDGNISYIVPAPITGDLSISGVILHIKWIIAGKPEYISHQEQCWLLAHIDDLLEFCDRSKISDEDYVFCGSRLIQFANMLRAAGRDFIYISRAIFLIEFIDAHIYGGSLGYFHKKWKSPVFKSQATLVGFSSGSELAAFPSQIALLFQEMSFKSWMAQKHFGGSEIIYTASSMDIGGNIANGGIEVAGYLYTGVVECFYKSKPAGHRMKYFKTVPFASKKSKSSKTRLEFDFAVFLPTVTSVVDLEGSQVKLITYVPLGEIVMHSVKGRKYIATNYNDPSIPKSPLLDQAVLLVNFEDGLRNTEYERLKKIVNDSNDKVMKRHLWGDDIH